MEYYWNKNRNEILRNDKDYWVEIGTGRQVWGFSPKIWKVYNVNILLSKLLDLIKSLQEQKHRRNMQIDNLKKLINEQQRLKGNAFDEIDRLFHTTINVKEFMGQLEKVINVTKKNVS